ncbi:CVNH protein [Rhizoctonia solani]|uniref:CVNH protein n=1 Tax=Rhizoctonia solani TaxID=456999 RepID=A0A8H7M9J1_9AGAM|nr:CVNH protein [Rhizoctonia solani]
MSFSETTVRPRILFGSYLTYHRQRDDSYVKSTIDLNSCIGNTNGTFTTNRTQSRSINAPLDVDTNVHLDGSNIIAELPINAPGRSRSHAKYDLDICLSNDNGELKWVQHDLSDHFLGRDGVITKAAEGIPGAGFLIALIHYRNNNLDHAKRATIISGKGIFAILFSVIALQLGPFDATDPSTVAILSFLGTVIADLTIEVCGREWIRDKRISAEIPNRSVINIFIDGLIAGIAVGAGASIAPHAEVAAAQAVRVVAQAPEEFLAAELELFSIQNLVYNGPKLLREIAKAGTGAVVRATSFGIHDYATHVTPYEAPYSPDAKGSKIKPGYYYISNLGTGQLLQFVISPETGRPCVQVADGNFKKSQLWIIEEGVTGYKLRAHFPGAYIGHAPLNDSGDSNPQIVTPDNAVEFRLEGSPLGGFSFVPIINAVDDLALSPKDIESGNALVSFTKKDTDDKLQRWLLEEDDGLDSLELHQGPVASGNPLRIVDASTKTPLQLAFKETKWPWARVKSKGDWTLEAGFKGYYLKHIASGLYMSLSDTNDDVKIRPLVLSPNKTEFTLIGNDEDGYSIEYVEDRQFGVKLDEDPADPGTTAFLSWQPDDAHPSGVLRRLIPTDE